MRHPGLAEKGVGGFTDKLEPRIIIYTAIAHPNKASAADPNTVERSIPTITAAGCDNVSDAVGCGGFERHGIYSVAEPAVKSARSTLIAIVITIMTIAAALQRTFALSREQLFRRTLKKLKSEHGYDHGDKESAKVLHSRMSERMLTVGGLSGEDVSDKNKSGRSRVRQVIYRIGDDRNTARYKTECKLGCKRTTLTAIPTPPAILPTASRPASPRSLYFETIYFVKSVFFLNQNKAPTHTAANVSNRRRCAIRQAYGCAGHNTYL